MTNEHFTLANFNTTLSRGITEQGKQKKQKLNYCSAVTKEPRKISVTLHYNPSVHWSEYAVLGPDLEVRSSSDFSSYYYGCSPKIDSQLIVKAISALSFRTEEELEAFIRQHHQLFMLHKEQKDFLPDIAKLILLTVASKYGICLKLDDSLKFLAAQIDRFPGILSLPESGEFIRISGCPTRELLALLEHYRFEKSGDLWAVSRDGCTLRSIYEKTANIRLLSGKVFYSGVLLKPLMIHNPDTFFESDGIKNIVLTYERTTFAMVCAFDENDLTHPLLAKSRPQLERAFRQDDDRKRTLINYLTTSRTDDRDHYENVTTYLKESFNGNQIGVSSNIRTADGKVFLGLRQAGNIDGGSLYPSVNGNAEVYDTDVSFYNHSVYEDLPSIHTQDVRSDLLGEISREAYGELRLVTRNESWESYGIVLSGTKPPEEGRYVPGARRFHFNVLFENEVDDTLAQIKEKKLSASESFENQDFIGIYVHCYKNPFRRFLAGIMKCIRYVLNSKNVVESLLLLFVTVSSYQTFVLSADAVSSFFSALFGGVAAVANLVQFVTFVKDHLHNRKTTRHICVYDNMNYEDMDGQVRKALGNHFHPVAYASLKMHVENIVYRKLPKVETEKEKVKA